MNGHDDPAARDGRFELARLRREHANIARLLIVLESHLADLHAGDGGGERVMSDALSYIVDYLDRFHRDREVLFVAALALHQPTVRGFLATLSVQHSSIRSDGAELCSRLDHLREMQSAEREDLVERGFSYCTELRRSMALEETILAFATAAIENAAPSPDEGDASSAHRAPPRAADDRYEARFEELTHRIGCDCAYSRSG